MASQSNVWVFGNGLWFSRKGSFWVQPAQSLLTFCHRKLHPLLHIICHNRSTQLKWYSVSASCAQPWYQKTLLPQEDVGHHKATDTAALQNMFTTSHLQFALASWNLCFSLSLSLPPPPPPFVSSRPKCWSRQWHCGSCHGCRICPERYFRALGLVSHWVLECTANVVGNVCSKNQILWGRWGQDYRHICVKGLQTAVIQNNPKKTTENWRCWAFITWQNNECDDCSRFTGRRRRRRGTMKQIHLRR